MYHPDTVYSSKVVRIRGYFSKPKGILEQKSLENTGLEHYTWEGMQ
jgi:hypothetical protein